MFLLFYFYTFGVSFNDKVDVTFVLLELTLLLKLEKAEELGLNPDQIYNAHDNGLLWRVQPNKQFL
jgi:hypothetical protein